MVFHMDSDTARYQEKNAELAWERTIQFFNKVLNAYKKNMEANVMRHSVLRQKIRPYAFFRCFSEVSLLYLRIDSAAHSEFAGPQATHTKSATQYRYIRLQPSHHSAENIWKRDLKKP